MPRQPGRTDANDGDVDDDHDECYDRAGMVALRSDLIGSCLCGSL